VVSTFQRVANEHELELLFVDDRSRDRSLAILLRLRELDPRVKVIHLSRNFGHQIAVTAGVDHATGDAVVLIDADLQDPPEVILDMLDKWYEGYKVVYGVRTARRGETLFKRATAGFFYRLLSRLTDLELPLDTGDFRLMDRVVVDALRNMREESRYVRGMVSWLGFCQCGVEYSRDTRFAGETKNSLAKMMRFAINGITSFSEVPLLLSSWLGALLTVVGLGLLAYVFMGKIADSQATDSRWAAVLALVTFLGGVQLLSLGIIGQYLGRVYREVKGRPLYVVESAWGFSETQSGAHRAVRSEPQSRVEPGRRGARSVRSGQGSLQDRSS
jgi:dolichol-phosphate mannosyltransferase